MCGIAGKIVFGGHVDRAVINRMCAKMEHRGPNSRGLHVEAGVGLGMQRLAIIDVAGGDQPIFNEDRSVAVVMNGEIYNFESLRDSLSSRGHTFATRTDTEVLVHLYEEYGEDFVKHLRGMFAFALWDARRAKLLLGRDRVGKKPLFWMRRGDTIWFASELMALIQDPAVPRTPDPRAIASYLTLQYVPHPMSAFVGVRKLSPATTLSATAGGQSEQRYWSLDYSAKIEGLAQPELEEQLRALIWESTKLRLISEVPLGAFLSGGVDSSAVVAAMADQMAEPVKTFSIGFGAEDFDELRYARMVADRFSTDHHEFMVEPHAMEIMPKLARHYGEPFADPSALPSFYLAQMTSKHVTVALNGDGGDESFAGYRRYVSAGLVTRLSGIPHQLRRLAPSLARPLGYGRRNNSTRSRIQRLATTLAMQPYDRYAHWMSAFPTVLHDRVFAPEFRDALAGWFPTEPLSSAWLQSTGRNDIDRMLDVDVSTYLPANLLVKMDTASMAYSVEARSPLLDHHLMEFAATLPADLKLMGGEGKRLLKASLRGIVPDEILDRPKMGFGVPLVHWFRGELRDLPTDVLLDTGAHTQKYVRRDEVERMIREHQDASADHSQRIWTLLQLEHWHREVVESPIPGESPLPLASAAP